MRRKMSILLNLKRKEILTRYKNHLLKYFIMNLFFLNLFEGKQQKITFRVPV